jgi:hypothetical protein
LVSAGSFGLLGGSGVTNTGSSVVNNGNVGSAPTATVTGFRLVSQRRHLSPFPTP